MRLSVMCNQFVLNISGRTVWEVIKQMSNDAQALRSTQQAFLDDYIDYNENLSETVYSNGVHVWVNRGGKAEKTSDGRSVAPYSFLIQ